MSMEAPEAQQNKRKKDKVNAEPAASADAFSGQNTEQLEAIVRQFESGDQAGAAAALEALSDTDAKVLTLLGTVLMMMENYQGALTKLERASELDPSSREIALKLAKCRTNLNIDTVRDFPANVPHEREKLLAPPAPVEGVLPPPPNEPRRTTLRDKLRSALGEGLGQVMSQFEHGAMKLIEVIGVSDEVWTNWYHRPSFLALLTLSYTRQQLNRNNLTDTYPEGQLTAFQSRGLVAPESAKYFRTADGSWNNLDNPKEGAAGVRFPRNINRAVTWPRNDRLLEPNPAEISQIFFKRPESGIKEVPFLNLLAAAWIQFNVHDWVSHVTHLDFGHHEVPLPADHPARTLFHQTKMFIGKTESDPTWSEDEKASPTHINEVTSWWDASQIYGSNQETADRLRSFAGGKLKMADGQRLPLGEAGFDDSGFVRNWWLGLSLLHTLFVREHNAVCDLLARKYPSWDDNRLYHTARLITAACIAKIHTVEWTPAILPNPVLQLAMNANWSGILESSLKPADERRVFPWLKVRNAEFGGIVGNPIDKHGKPYGLSEEFTEIYRLHDLLPDTITIRNIQGSEAEQVALADTRLKGSRQLADRHGMANLLYSFGNTLPGQLVLNNFPDTLRTLSLPGNPVFDLATVDILRARERGVPRYNEFRRQLGLKPITKFEDLTSDPEVVENLRRVYQHDIEAIDLLVGTRAESQRPTGYGFGETMFQLFILNASRRLQADRFYTDSYNAETYTQEGLDWIDACTFKSVLLRHYPELADTGLGNVVNAFEPWDAGPLDPARHPLNAFIKN